MVRQERFKLADAPQGKMNFHAKEIELQTGQRRFLLLVNSFDNSRDMPGFALRVGKVGGIMPPARFR